MPQKPGSDLSFNDWLNTKAGEEYSKRFLTEIIAQNAARRPYDTGAVTTENVLHFASGAASGDPGLGSEIRISVTVPTGHYLRKLFLRAASVSDPVNTAGGSTGDNVGLLRFVKAGVLVGELPADTSCATKPVKLTGAPAANNADTYSESFAFPNSTDYDGTTGAELIAGAGQGAILVGMRSNAGVQRDSVYIPQTLALVVDCDKIEYLNPKWTPFHVAPYITRELLFYLGVMTLPV